MRVELLQEAWQHLVARHDAFRTYFPSTSTGLPYALVLPMAGYKVPYKGGEGGSLARCAHCI